MAEKFWSKVKKSLKDSWEESKEDAKRKETLKKQQKQEEANAKRQEIAFWFGDSEELGMRKTANFYMNRLALKHVKENVLNPGEIPKKVIFVEFDLHKDKEVNGVLIATDTRVIFAYKSDPNQFLDSWDYDKIKGISLEVDGLTKWELIIEFGNTRKKFDDLKKNDDLEQFLEIVNSEINRFPAKKINSTTQEHSSEKYDQIERIAELREKGILTEDEFKEEKKKILNS